MFSVGSYAKIKSVENKENYSDCKITISKKNKKTDKYELTFSNTVRFIGKAHLQRPMVDQKIKITSCGVSNCYIKDGNVEYLKHPSFLIFEYELQESAPQNDKPTFEVVNDEVLPF